MAFGEEKFAGGAEFVCAGKNKGLSTGRRAKASWEHVRTNGALLFFGEAKISFGVFGGVGRV